MDFVQNYGYDSREIECGSFRSDLHMYVRNIASFLLGEDGERLFSF